MSMIKSKEEKYIVVRDRTEIIPMQWGGKEMTITTSLERAFHKKLEMESQFVLTTFTIYRLVSIRSGV